MIGKMAVGNPPFCHLIQFITPQSQAENDKEKGARKTYSSQYDREGEDVRKFYETVINEDSASKKNVTSSGRAHAQVKRKTKEHCNSVITKTKSLSRIAHDDVDKKTGLKEKEKTLCFKTNDTASQTSGADFNKSSSQVSFHTHRLHLKLLQAAQTGELEEVSKLLQQGADINYQDFYGWTPLMVAAKEGHEKVVKYLLKHGSDHTICSLEGQTASVLAGMSGHKHIVKTILEFSVDDATCDDVKQKSNTTSECVLKESNITSDGVYGETDSSGTYFCQICKSEFSLSLQTSHETSTVHLFNSGHKPKGPSYLIPETNKGFQMLLKTGWEADKGLGPNGEGPRYPVKTILKHDRKGFGSDDCVKKKARITHFNPNDKSAITPHCELPQRKITARKAAQYAAKTKERKDRRFEQRLRLELSGGFE